MDRKSGDPHMSQLWLVKINNIVIFYHLWIIEASVVVFTAQMTRFLSWNILSHSSCDLVANDLLKMGTRSLEFSIYADC